MKQRCILVLYTGGTFGMDEHLKIPNLSAAALQSRLENQVPEMSRVADCDVEIFFNLDSCQMNATHWFKLAERLNAAKTKYDGAVILHGTDSLAYTASALSYLLSPTPFPVVLTGAQRPLATLRSDARINFISALEVAASAPKNLRDRVLVVFHDELFLGSRVRKKSALDFAAFESPRFPILAKIGSTIHYEDSAAQLTKLSPKTSFAKYFETAKFNLESAPKVLPIVLMPSFPFSSLTDSLLRSLDAVLLTLYTSGTAPTDDLKFLDFLKRARKNHTPVLAITERADAPAKISTYPAGLVLQEEGVIWCADLTPEAAYVKVFLNKLSKHQLTRPEFLLHLKKNWRKPISDEQTE